MAEPDADFKALKRAFEQVTREKDAALADVSRLEEEKRELTKKLKQTNPQDELQDSKTSTQTETLDVRTVTLALLDGQEVVIRPMTFKVGFDAIYCMGVSLLLGGPPLKFYLPDKANMSFPTVGATECTGFTVHCSSDGFAKHFREAVKQALSRIVMLESDRDAIVTREENKVTVDISLIELDTESPLSIGLVSDKRSATGGGSRFGFTVYHNHRNDYSSSEAKISSSFIGCATCRGRAVHQCSRCKGAYYCSKGCQDTHWLSGHKHLCRKINSR